MIRKNKYLVLSIISLLASVVLFYCSYFRDISVRLTYDFDFSSHFIIRYVLGVGSVVCFVFALVFAVLFMISGRIKKDKVVFVVSLVVFVIVTSVTILGAYFSTDLTTAESIDLLTEKKRSVESFEPQLQKYLLKNSYYEYENKYVLIKKHDIPRSTYTYVECLPWEYGEWNIEYHLECLESTNNNLIDKFKTEIFFRNSIYDCEQTYEDDSYILYEGIYEDDSETLKYINVVVEKENCIFSVELYAAEETINELGKNKIIEDVMLNLLEIYQSADDSTIESQTD